MRKIDKLIVNHSTNYRKRASSPETNLLNIRTQTHSDQPRRCLSLHPCLDSSQAASRISQPTTHKLHPSHRYKHHLCAACRLGTWHPPHPSPQTLSMNVSTHKQTQKHLKDLEQQRGLYQSEQRQIIHARLHSYGKHETPLDEESSRIRNEGVAANDEMEAVKKLRRQYRISVGLWPRQTRKQNCAPWCGCLESCIVSYRGGLL